MLITKQKFAKLARVKSCTIATNVAKGHLIEDSKTKKLDTENPKNKIYLKRRIKIDESEKSEKKITGKIGRNQYSNFDDEEQKIDEYTSMAIKEQEYKVEKLKMDVKVKELLLKEKRGDLVSKQKISDVCFGYLDALNKNMLVVPQVFIERVENFVKHNPDSKDMKQALLNEITLYITKSIQNTKQQVVQKINSNYTSDDNIEAGDEE